MKTKKCTKCQKEKTPGEFTKHKLTKDGLQSQCKECKREWSLQNKEKVKEYINNNKEKKKKYDKDYNQKNKNFLNEKRKIKKRNNSLFRFKNNIRINIGNSFKRACNGIFKKKSKSIEILGCDFSFFIEHITSQFKEGMTLENYGEWHLDHIIPISSAQTEEDIVKLCHYSNYQPLWAEDNFKKSNKMLGD